MRLANTVEISALVDKGHNSFMETNSWTILFSCPKIELNNLPSVK